MDVLVAVLAIALLLALGTVLLVVRRRAAARRPLSAPTSVIERARPGLGAMVRALVGGKSPGQGDWQGMEEALIRADVGPLAAADLVTRIRERFTPEADPAALLAEEVVAVLGDRAALSLRPGELAVVMVVGVNGSGKTTTIGKLAGRLAAKGRTVCLANSDTFRAAATEQLSVWADRAGAHLVSQARGADPGAVAFDAVRAAQARNADVLIVDTAGRLHTRTPLMGELRKVKRVLEKAAGDVEEVLLVLDATTGQNGIAQARAFTEAVEVTGVALTKMDGTARGGVVLAVREQLGIPVKLVGTGETIDALEPFDPRAFANRLIGS
jgi:fused signal recognition particle receptor